MENAPLKCYGIWLSVREKIAALYAYIIEILQKPMLGFSIMVLETKILQSNYVVRWKP